MTNKALKIVLVEDIDTDAELIQWTLRKADISFVAKVVETAEDFKKVIESEKPDLILSDYTLPRFTAKEALKIKKELAPEIPFILVTGAQTEEIAVASIKEGADDYILKSNLTRLPTSVLNALRTSESRRDKRNAQKALELNEAKYRHLFENSLVGLLRWKLTNGFILEHNRKASEFIELFCDEENLFHDCFLNKEDYHMIVSALKEHGIIENIEFQVKSKEKAPKWLSLSAKLFDDLQEVEAVLIDISSSKQNILELQKVNYELERFVYHASHDLKSPLKSIQGLVEAARESQDLEESLGFLDMFEHCANKLELLVNDLLLLARMNKIEENISDFKIEEELDSILGLLQHSDSFKNVRIDRSIVQKRALYSDTVRLRIILNNLISNSIKYRKPEPSDTLIRISFVVEQDKTLIEISDNGQGIEERHLPRIFDMFYRASKHHDGSGLGLYIVKSMMDQMGGKINVQSSPNVGTTFFLELPMVALGNTSS
jgi:signal transduction histidine kinase/DNA-binding NarL/FixJ family response regulator